jgi:hypothetical protein
MSTGTRRSGRRSAALAALLVLYGCGGGPPRRPEPPPGARSADPAPPARGSASGPTGVAGDQATERFEVRGTRDTWDEPIPIIDGLKRLGGVKDAYVDEATGKYVVVYDPRRTTREQLDARVREVGKDQGREFEPIFDSR